VRENTKKIREKNQKGKIKEKGKREGKSS